MSAFSNKCLIVLCFVSISIFALVKSDPGPSFNGGIGRELQKELVLTKKEKHALDELKRFIPNNLTMDYLYKDLFQIRWLRAKKLDVGRTLRDMNEFMALRRQSRVDNFMSEYDWSDLFSRPPFWIEGLDKEGRPIMFLSLSDGFDIRRIVLQGKRDRLNKYIINVGFAILEEVVAQNKRHANITQIAFLLNMDGLSAVQHACPLCISAYLFLLQLYELYLPGFCHDIIIINASSPVALILEAVRPVLSDHTNRVLKIFAPNRRQWKAFLDSKIDPKELPWEFGGTMRSDRE